MLYSTTDLAQRGVRPMSGEHPVEEQDFRDENHLRRTRYWWRLDQAVAVKFRSEDKRLLAERTMALIEAAEGQHLIVRAHTDPETGDVGYEVHDGLLHLCAGGRDQPLSLADAELLIVSFVRPDFRSSDRPHTAIPVHEALSNGVSV